MKELDAGIAFSNAAATAAPPGGGLVQWKTVSEDGDIIGEVPSEVSSLSLRFAGLLGRKSSGSSTTSSRQSISIGYATCEASGMKRFRIKTGLASRKALGVYKDFGKQFHEMWGEAFINYTTVIIRLFGKVAPNFHAEEVDSQV